MTMKRLAVGAGAHARRGCRTTELCPSSAVHTVWPWTSPSPSLASLKSFSAFPLTEKGALSSESLRHSEPTGPKFRAPQDSPATSCSLLGTLCSLPSGKPVASLLPPAWAHQVSGSSAGSPSGRDTESWLKHIPCGRLSRAGSWEDGAGRGGGVDVRSWQGVTGWGGFGPRASLGWGFRD